MKPNRTVIKIAALALALPGVAAETLLTCSQTLGDMYGFADGDPDNTLEAKLNRTACAGLSGVEQRSVETALEIAHIAEQLPKSVQRDLLAMTAGLRHSYEAVA